MTKVRGLMIVLHDKQKCTLTKEHVKMFIEANFNYRQYVIAEEPYTHQEGSHIHVFLQVKVPIHFSSALKKLSKFWTAGRVQIDQMRGEMAQACAYLKPEFSKKGELKDYDSSPITYLDLKTAEEVQEKVAVITEEDWSKFTSSERIHLLKENSPIIREFLRNRKPQIFFVNGRTIFA